MRGATANGEETTPDERRDERTQQHADLDVLVGDARGAVGELADEERVIALAAKRSERIDADRQVRQAEIVARKDIDTTDVSREQALEAARIERPAAARRGCSPSATTPG